MTVAALRESPLSLEWKLSLGIIKIDDPTLPSAQPGVNNIKHYDFSGRATCALMAELMYGAGLRVHECVTLRFKHIDLASRTVSVRNIRGSARTDQKHSCFYPSSGKRCRRALRAR
jgi:integrase